MSLVSDPSPILTTASQAVQPTPSSTNKKTAKAGQPKRLYKVVESSSIIGLQTEVSLYLNEGWHLVGGVALGTTERNRFNPEDSGTCTMYHQALVNKL